MLHKIKKWVSQYVYGLIKTYVITQSLAQFNLSPLIVSGILAMM